MSFFQQMTAAIYKFESYPALIMNKASKVIGYLVMFTVIITFISLVPMGISYFRAGGITGLADKYIPEFSLNDGKFSCEKIDYENNEVGLKIYIDTESGIDKSDIDKYGMYILADSDKAYVSNGIQTEEINFSNYSGSIDRTKTMEILNSKVFKVTFYGIFAVSLIVSTLIGTIFNIFILALVGSIINTIFIKSQIKLSKLMTLAVYARTFPNLLAVIVGLAGFSYSSLITWGIIITYMYLGLMNYKKGSGVILAEL